MQCIYLYADQNIMKLNEYEQPDGPSVQANISPNKNSIPFCETHSSEEFCLIVLFSILQRWNRKNYLLKFWVIFQKGNKYTHCTHIGQVCSGMKA